MPNNTPKVGDWVILRDGREGRAESRYIRGDTVYIVVRLGINGQETRNQKVEVPLSDIVG